MLEDEKKILKLFPLPIFHYRIKDHKKHNENLSKYIYNLYKNDKSGLKRSNQGGWHSKPFDLKKKDDAPFHFFMDIQKYVATYFCISIKKWKGASSFFFKSKGFECHPP